MKRTLDVPKPGGGVTTGTILATWRQSVGGKRLVFHAVKAPPPYGEVTLTEAGSRMKFGQHIAEMGERCSARQALLEGRAIVRMAVETHGAAHVLRVIARATKYTLLLPEFRK